MPYKVIKLVKILNSISSQRNVVFLFIYFFIDVVQMNSLIVIATSLNQIKKQLIARPASVIFSRADGFYS